MAMVRFNPQRSATRSQRNTDGHHQPRSASAATAVNGSLLSAEDVAALIGMTKDWIYTETRAGRIPHVALGRYYRYRRESIDAWLRELEHGPGESRRQAPPRR